MREHNRRALRPLLVTEYAKGDIPALTPGAFILNRSVSAEHIPSVSDILGKSLKPPSATLRAAQETDEERTNRSFHSGVDGATIQSEPSISINPNDILPTSAYLSDCAGNEVKNVEALSNHDQEDDGQGSVFTANTTVFTHTAPASPSTSTHDRMIVPKKVESTFKRRKSKELEDLTSTLRKLKVPVRQRVRSVAHLRANTAIPMVVTSYRNEIRCVDGAYVTIRYTDTTRPLTNPPCEACGVLARKSSCRFDNCGDCCRIVNNHPCKTHRTKAYAMFLTLREEAKRQKRRKQHGMCLLYQAGQCRKGSACYYDHGEGPEVSNIDFEIGTPLRITLCVRDYENERERSTRNDKMSLPQSVLMTALAKELSSPYTFQINKRGSKKMTHGGVWEFTAPENSLLLSPLMQFRLGVQPGDTVELKSVTLPRGTFAKFRALDLSSWRRIPAAMVRSLLEFELRKHQTLSVGSVVDVVFADRSCQLEVMECKPSQAISLVDSELAFDIDVSDSPTTLDLNEGFKTDTSTVLIPGHRTHGVLPAIDPVNLVVHTETITTPSVLTFKVSCINTVSAVEETERHSKPGKRSIHPRLLLSQSEPQPSITSHTWWGGGEGTSTHAPTVTVCTACDPDYHHALDNMYASVSANVLVDGKKLQTEGSEISGTCESATYEFSTEVQPSECGGDATKCPVGRQRRSSDSQSASPSSTASAGNNIADGEACRNCGLSMPLPRLISHERHCRNNTYSCSTCETQLPVASREWHEAFMHTRATCVCDIELTHYALLTDHVRRRCPKRMIKCANLGCLLLTPADSSAEHLRECGSVTIACPICKENVCRSDAVFHFEAMHGIQADQLRSGMALEDQVAALIAAGKVYDF